MLKSLVVSVLSSCEMAVGQNYVLVNGNVDSTCGLILTHSQIVVEHSLDLLNSRVASTGCAQWSPHWAGRVGNGGHGYDACNAAAVSAALARSRTPNRHIALQS